MGYPSGTLGTLMELYEGVTGGFVGYLRGLKGGELGASATVGGEEVSVRGILRHVTESGYAYAAYARGAVKGERPAVPVGTPEFADPVEGVQAVVGRMAEALRGCWDMTDREIDATSVETSWGTRYTLEQILDHAIVHILWHERQCRRVIRFAMDGGGAA